MRSVRELQHILHAHDLVIWHAKENNTTLRQLANEINSNTHLQERNLVAFEVAGWEVRLDYFICADQRSRARELGMDQPNSRSDDAIRCWACGVTK